MITRIFVLILLLPLLPACTGQAAVRGGAGDGPGGTAMLADAAYDNGDWLESEQHYNRLVEQDPGIPLYWLRLGNIYTRTGRPGEAVGAYQEALALDGTLEDAWYNMSLVQLKLAAYTLNEMQARVDPADPLAERGRLLLEGLLELIQLNEPEAGGEAALP